MTRTLVALVLLAGTVNGHQVSKGPNPQLAAERSPRYSFEKDVLELRASGGWLRTPRMHPDFRLAFDFRAIAGNTDAGLIVRSWPGKDGWPNQGYRFRLPTDEAPDAATVFEGRRKPVRVIEHGRVETRPAGEWQQLEVIGAGRQLTFVMNGVLVGVFEVEEFVGHIMFDARDGRVQVRNIRLDEEASSENPGVRPDGVIRFKRLQELGGQVPKLLQHVGARYPPEAMERGMQGRVELEAVILPNGAVHAVGVVRSVHPALDESAIAAIRQWKLQPGLLHGKPVAVLMDVDMSFTTR